MARIGYLMRPDLLVYGLVGWSWGGLSALLGGFLVSRVVEWGVPAAAIVGGAVLCKEFPKVGRIGTALAFLGDASYSLYLVHPIALLVLRRVLLTLIDPITAPRLYAVVFFVGPVLAAVFIYLAFEKPVTRWLRRTLDIGGTAPIQGWLLRLLSQR